MAAVIYIIRIFCNFNFTRLAIAPQLVLKLTRNLSKFSKFLKLKWWADGQNDIKTGTTHISLLIPGKHDLRVPNYAKIIDKELRKEEGFW